MNIVAFYPLVHGGHAASAFILAQLQGRFQSIRDLIPIPGIDDDGFTQFGCGTGQLAQDQDSMVLLLDNPGVRGLPIFFYFANFRNW